jgi:hypothetical protein
MVSLKEKVVNCYKQYLTNLIYGIHGRDYKLLYAAILLLRNNIDNPKYIEFLNNNLTCPTTIKLV